MTTSTTSPTKPPSPAMTSSSAGGSGGGRTSQETYSTTTTSSSSFLSPHAAPFTLRRHSDGSAGGGGGDSGGCGTAVSSVRLGAGGEKVAALRPRPSYPLGRLQEGDAAGSVDNSFLIYGEPIMTSNVLKHQGSSYSLLPTTYLATEPCESVHPPSTYGTYTGQLNSWSRNPMDFYPATTCSTSGIVFAPSVTMTSVSKEHNSLASGHLKGNNGSTNTISKTVSLLNKTQERDTSSCSITGKADLRENAKSGKDAGNSISLPGNSEIGVPFDDKATSGDLMNCSKEANPVFSLKPLHIPNTCAPSCGFAYDDTKHDSSECSVDSPCWKGASTFRQSSFNVVQTAAPQPIAEELEALSATGAGQKNSSSTVQCSDSLSELENVVNSKSKEKFDPSQVELCMVKKSGDVNKLSSGHAKDSHGKELERAKYGTAKHNVDQKRDLELKNNYIKQSGLNSAAPDFVPLAIGKPKFEKGPCSSTKKNISGLLKAMQSLSAVLLNSFSDDKIELEEQGQSLLDLVIQNLETCLHKTRKGPVKDISNKSGLKAPHSQTIVSKSDVRNYTGIYTAHGGKSEMGSDFTRTGNELSDFGEVNRLTRAQIGQPSQTFNNFPKRIPYEEEHSHVLLYKNLWIDAERANCQLKYQLKCTRMKIDMESSKAHTGGPRNSSFHVSDFSTDPNSSYGTISAYPPMLSIPKDHPTEEISSSSNGQNLLYPADRTQSGARDTLHCSSSTEGYPVPKNLHGKHIPTGLEESSMQRHAQDELQVTQNKSNRVHSCIVGRNGNLLSGSDYRSSDWEHVLKEELGWS